MSKQNLADSVPRQALDDPHTLSSRNNLASAYQDAGTWAGAILLQQTLGRPAALVLYYPRP